MKKMMEDSGENPYTQPDYQKALRMRLTKLQSEIYSYAKLQV